jgi:hypothetical protein
MPTRVSRNGLTRLARGLTSGALVLTALSWGGGALTASHGVSSGGVVLAQDIDCYNDKDLYDTPECVERRANDARQGNQPASANQPAGQGGDSQPQGGDQGQTQQPPQQAGQPPAQEEPEEKPRGPLTNPWDAVLTLQDCGKEAYIVDQNEGSDKYGRWAFRRCERDRSNSASTLGANVIHTKVWVASNIDQAKALYKEQSDIKNFPERKEPVQGPNEKAGKPNKYAEEMSFQTAYYQDQDDKIWHHWRFVLRKGTTVAVLYLFGREEFFQDRKDHVWTQQADWYLKPLDERM